MLRNLAIVALGAVCCLFSGCGGCSKDKGGEPSVQSRMEDSDYTNRLVQIHGRLKGVAANAAAIRAQLEKLGTDAEGKPEYVDLTNRLAQCETEKQRIRKEALLAVRARIAKDSPKKSDLKK